MRKKWFISVVSALGFLLAIHVNPTLAQKTGKNLSVMYSNNINGEVDPCPT